MRQIFRHKPLVLFIAMLLSAPLSAQENVPEQMNQVKLDGRYVYGEATDENAAQAFDDAVYDLAYAVECGNGMVVDIERLKQNVEKMSYLRGKKTCMLVFIKKEILASCSGTDTLPLARTSPPAPTAGTSKPSIQVTLRPGPPAAAAPAPMASAPKAAPQTPAALTGSPSGDAAATGTGKKAEPLARELLGMENAVVAYEKLCQKKRQGLVADVGLPKDARNLEQVYVVVFDKSTELPLAVLSPVKANGLRDNLDDGSETSLSRFGGIRMVWFSLP